jgi:hypothetical protein
VLELLNEYPRGQALQELLAEHETLETQPEVVNE